jgi:hypothetical protein
MRETRRNAFKLVVVTKRHACFRVFTNVQRTFVNSHIVSRNIRDKSRDVQDNLITDFYGVTFRED